LTEAHGRLFGHLKPLKFFDEAAVSTSFNFISAYQVLEKDGLDGLLKSLAHMVRQYKAEVLFLDGVASAEDLAKSRTSFKKFVHDLNAVLSASGCTTVLLSSFVDNLTHPEHTMVDGIIELTALEEGMRMVRQIEVKKLRGSNHLRGRHFFDITDIGVSVYPRIEAFLGLPTLQKSESDAVLKTGNKRLDELFGGGLTSGSVTSVLGSSGTGKTLLGCKFLETGAEKGETGIYFGFYEHPVRLMRKTEKDNPPLFEHDKSGKIEMIWQPPLETTIDQLAAKLLEAVRSKKVKRLFIDGISGLAESMVEHKRIYRALAALVNELRALGVTTLFTEETALFPLEVKTPVSDQPAITDNTIYLRHVDVNCQLVRLISVPKSRETPSSGGIHSFQISSKGIEIGEVFQAGERLPTGTPRKMKPTLKKKHL
jgi:circadian clock protein KaiC